VRDDVGHTGLRREGDARSGRRFRRRCDRWYGHGKSSEQRGDRGGGDETTSFDYHTLFPHFVQPAE
jgi:hypothetical protein